MKDGLPERKVRNVATLIMMGNERERERERVRARRTYMRRLGVLYLFSMPHQ
jgi:hypothetical protein